MVYTERDPFQGRRANKIRSAIYNIFNNKRYLKEIKIGRVNRGMQFSRIFELPSIRRNEVMYDVFRYSHGYSNYVR